MGEGEVIGEGKAGETVGDGGRIGSSRKAVNFWDCVTSSPV